MCVFCLLPTGWEKRATVSDAAVVWAGKKKKRLKKRRGNERKWRREVAKGCAER